MDIKIFDGGLSPSVVEMYHIRLAEAFYDLKDRLWYRDHFKWNQEWDQDLISDLYRELSLVMRVPPKDRMLGSISMMTRSLEHRLPAHVDAHKENQRSVLFCLNSKWNTDWGGEILFFEGDEARETVSIKPGRIISYDGRIPHCYTVPDTPPHITRYLTLFNF